MRTKLLFVAALLCGCCGVRAQSVSMLSNAPRWIYFMGTGAHHDLNSGFRYCCDSDNIFYTDGTEVIGGKTYQRLCISVLHLDGGSMRSPRKTGYSDDDIYDGEFLVGLREEGGRVYVNEAEYMDFLRGTGRKGTLGNPDYVPYERTDDGELVLYDFTMKAGDKFRSVEGYPDVWVAEVKDTLLDDNVTRRMQVLSNGMVVIEGIGCIYSAGMLPAYLNPKPAGADDMGTDISLFAVLTRFSTEQQVVFSKDFEDYEGFFVTGIVPAATLQGGTDKDDGRAPLYDLTGRRVVNPQPGHLYIRSSKKVVYTK